MKFLDHAKIVIRSGSGGRGAASFRREKFIEFGGPDGGDGGKGGDVIVKAVDHLNTLIDYRYQQHFFAENGRSGAGSQRTGRSGADVVLELPVGTVIYDAETEEMIADLMQLGQSIVIARGGNGGWGNLRFKTSTNRAPAQANPGQPGIEMTLSLELKILADIGLLGLPNAGKSTFLSAVSNARPKIADYPFTTLYPHLGVVRVDGREFVIADIPGLIEGAHMGKGIGDRFLGHLERSSALLHLVDATSSDVIQDYDTVINELSLYGAGLASKPRFTVLSKTDAMDADAVSDLSSQLKAHTQAEVYVMSAVSGEGVVDVLRVLGQHVRSTSHVEETVESKRWEP